MEEARGVMRGDATESEEMTGGVRGGERVPIGSTQNVGASVRVGLSPAA